MKISPYAWSFGKSNKHEAEKTDRRFTPGPGMYNQDLKKGTPSWK